MLNFRAQSKPDKRNKYHNDKRNAVIIYNIYCRQLEVEPNTTFNAEILKYNESNIESEVLGIKGSIKIASKRPKAEGFRF